MTQFAVEEDSGSLDQFSTSPTLFGLVLSSFVRCDYGAPFFAYCEGGARYRVVQGCCNHWDCVRCGQLVAAKHYGRIVEGARRIAENQQLWFITVTCRGKEVTVREATDHYLEWTSRFLDACYTKQKRAGKDWYYVQVTEKQRRGHPHSHLVTTFSPDDLVQGEKDNWITSRDGARNNKPVECLRSDWLEKTVARSGLGAQYDISKVENIEGASRYVAKYMFKKSQFSAQFPKHWKRVRYSQSWPKLERVKSDAFVLLSREDWKHLGDIATIVDASAGEAFEIASFELRDMVKVNLSQEEKKNDNHIR
jgi:hypothetical protein